MIQICRKGKAELYPPPIQSTNHERSEAREGGYKSKRHARNMHARARTHAPHAAATWFFFFLPALCLHEKVKGRGGGLGWRTKKVKKSFDFFFLNYSFLACLG